MQTIANKYPRVYAALLAHIKHARHGRPCKPARCQPVGRVALRKQRQQVAPAQWLYSATYANGTHYTYCTYQGTPAQLAVCQQWHRVAHGMAGGVWLYSRLARSVQAKMGQHITPPKWAQRALLAGCNGLQRMRAAVVQRTTGMQAF